MRPMSPQKTREREKFTRDFHLQIPVINYDAFVRLADNLVDILYFLTSDNWNIVFSPRDGTQEPRKDWKVAEAPPFLSLADSIRSRLPLKNSTAGTRFSSLVITRQIASFVKARNDYMHISTQLLNLPLGE